MNKRRDLIEGIAEQRKLVAIRKAQLETAQNKGSREEEQEKESALKVAETELAEMLRMYTERVDLAIDEASEAWNKAMTDVMLEQGRITIAMADKQEAAWQLICEVMKEKKDVLLEGVINTEMMRKELA